MQLQVGLSTKVQKLSTYLSTSRVKEDEMEYSLSKSMRWVCIQTLIVRWALLHFSPSPAVFSSAVALAITD